MFDHYCCTPRLLPYITHTYVCAGSNTHAIKCRHLRRCALRPSSHQVSADDQFALFRPTKGLPVYTSECCCAHRKQGPACAWAAFDQELGELGGRNGAFREIQSHPEPCNSNSNSDSITTLPSDVVHGIISILRQHRQQVAAAVSVGT